MSRDDDENSIDHMPEVDTGVHVMPVPRNAAPIEHVRHDVRVEEFRREKADREIHRQLTKLEQSIDAKLAQRDQQLSALATEIAQWNVHIFGFKDQGKGRFGQLENDLIAQGARIEEHARMFKKHAETFEKLERVQFKIVVSASLAGSAVAIVISVLERILS